MKENLKCLISNIIILIVSYFGVATISYLFSEFIVRYLYEFSGKTIIAICITYTLVGTWFLFYIGKTKLKKINTLYNILTFVPIIFYLVLYNLVLIEHNYIYNVIRFNASIGIFYACLMSFFSESIAFSFNIYKVLPLIVVSFAILGFKNAKSRTNKN